MSGLWTVALFFRFHGRRENLIFRDKDRALLAFDKFRRDEPWASDDFGCNVAIFPHGPLEMVALVEEERAVEAEAALALLRVRAKKYIDTFIEEDLEKEPE